MANNLIKNVKDLDAFITSVMEGPAFTASIEKERQKALSSDLTGLKKSGDKKEVDEAEEADEDGVGETEEDTTQTKKGDVASGVPNVTKKKLKRASLGDITKMLNVLRSGHSLKDPGVKSKLGAYLDGLSSSEKETLYIFITGLAEIMVDETSGKEAIDPSDVGIKINVKADREKPPSADPSTQTGTESSPIIVGEVADRSLLREKIRRSMV